MTIDEIRKERKLFEKVLREYIVDALSDFRTRTGASITEIDIWLETIEDLEGATRSILTEVEATVTL